MSDFFGPQPLFSQNYGTLDNGAVVNMSILPLQVMASDPTLPTLEQHSGMLSTDRHTSERTSNFDPDLYNLQDTSHLSRFLRALLGDAGVGQLRKRYTIARLQQTIAGSHFYDLDGFWGSLLSVNRRPSETLPGDPMVTNYLPDQWDDIARRDGLYRERILGLAKSIAMSGTVSGIKGAAEAIMQAEVEVYEGWRELENTEVSDGRTWNNVQSDYPTWDSFRSISWGEIENRVTAGNLGPSSVDEVWIQPLKHYGYMDGTYPSQDSDTELQEDINDTIRVLEKIKPAGVFISVNPSGIEKNVELTPAGLFADSEFWQIVSTTSPNQNLDLSWNPYQTGVSVPTLGMPGLVLPSPPFSNQQTTEWFYNINVKSAEGYRTRGGQDFNTGRGGRLYSGDEMMVEYGASTMGFAYYKASYALTDPVSLAMSLGSKDSIIQVAPYAAPRTVVKTYG